MNGLEDYFRALKAVRLAIHEVAISGHHVGAAELRLDDDPASVRELRNAEKDLAFTARELVRAVDALPLNKRPKGWTEAAA